MPKYKAGYLLDCVNIWFVYFANFCLFLFHWFSSINVISICVICCCHEDETAGGIAADDFAIACLYLFPIIFVPTVIG